MVQAAIRPLLPAALSPAYVSGMTGDIVRRADDVLRYNDLQALLVPGLAALGLHTELLTLPEDEDELLRLLQERLRHGVKVPLFAFAEETDTALSEPTEAPEGDEEADFDRNSERTATAQALVSEVDGDAITWQVGEDRTTGSASELRRAFSHLLRICRAGVRGSRRVHIHAALMRWIAFSAAYPERVPSADQKDDVVRACATAFLEAVAGAQRSPTATRLRRAMECLRNADVEAALLHVREALFREMRLPAVVQGALLSLPSTPLSDVERRELIYLARAGTRELKTLAARRLQPESRLRDVYHTLEQLGYDPDAWVRAAARLPAHPSQNR
jgi:hypothetical protein